jgi:Concanavalin A-like lectin/glucanases superfamily
MIQGEPYTGWELHVGTPAGGSGPGLLNVWLINNYELSFIQVNSPIPVLDGAWHHAALTYDGSGRAAGVKIYVDGVEATGAATADSLSGSLLNSVDLDLGTRQDGAIHNFTGSLREVSLWSIALKSGNVASIYQSGPPLPPLRLANPHCLTPSTFSFGWNSVIGTAYQIQSSSNLVHWTVVQDFYPRGGATATNTIYAGGILSPGMNFYRVRPEP